MSTAQERPSLFFMVPSRLVLALKFALLFALLFFVAWLAVLGDQNENLAALEAREQQLKETFLDKKKQAINLPAYRRQLEDVERQFGAVTRTLPLKYHGGHERIMRAATLHGLRIDQMNVADGEQLFDYYAQLPANLRITGAFHDLAALLNDVAALDALVVIRDFQIQGSTMPGMVSMDASVSEFRYLDMEEMVAQLKKAAAARKAAKK